MNETKRKRYSKITRQTIFSFATTILILLMTTLTIPILTRGLDIEEYGAYSIIATTVLMMSVVLEFGFSSYLLTKLPGMKKKREKRVFFSILLFNGIIVLALVVLALIPTINIQILSFLKLSEYRMEFNIGLLIIFLSVVLGLFLSKLHADRRIEAVNIAKLLNNGLWLMLLACFFALFRRVFLSGVMLIWLIVVLLTLLAAINFEVRISSQLKKLSGNYDLRKRLRRHLKKFDFSEIRRALRFSLPILFVIAASWIIDSLGKYFLNYFSGRESVAIFSFSYSIVGALLTLNAALVSTLYPYISEMWQKKKEHNFLFNAILKYGLIILLPIVIGAFAMREQIITLIAGGKYLPASGVIAIMLPFPILHFLTTIKHYNLLLREKTRTIALVYLIGIIVSIFANIILVPKMNEKGAAIAILMSSLAMYLMMLAKCKRHFKWNLRFLNLWKIISAAAIMGIFMVLANPQVLLTKLLTALAGGCVYLTLLMVMKVFTEEETDFLKCFLKF